MAFTQTDLDKLEKAIASGVKKVKFSDREVEYHSMEEMLKARDLMRRQLKKAGGGSEFFTPGFTKGTQ